MRIMTTSLEQGAKSLLVYVDCISDNAWYHCVSLVHWVLVPL
jgi:hypothetical protein